MFTGLVSNIGKISTITGSDDNKSFVISHDGSLKTKISDSVSVDGACMTITKKSLNSFTVVAMPETLNRTLFGTYKKASSVNLELPLKISDRLGGHFVTGHVDFMAKIINIDSLKGSKTLHIEFPPSFCKYFAFKGSVCVNGVSLTISKLESRHFEVSLIPYTLKNTNLGLLKKDDYVNIEVDLISRYLDSLLKDKAKESTYQFLQERGFI